MGSQTSLNSPQLPQVSVSKSIESDEGTYRTLAVPFSATKQDIQQFGLWGRFGSTLTPRSGVEAELAPTKGKMRVKKEGLSVILHKDKVVSRDGFEPSTY